MATDQILYRLAALKLLQYLRYLTRTKLALFHICTGLKLDLFVYFFSVLFSGELTPAIPLVSTSSLGVCLGDTILVSTPVGANLTGYLWSIGDTTQTIKLFNPGTYNVSVRTKNTFGCYSNSSLPVTVSVNPHPAIPLVPNDTLCTGDTAIFNLPQGLNYTWSGGFQGNSFTTTSGGSYWVVAKDNLGCQSDTARFDLAQFPIPATPLLFNIGDTLYTELVVGASYKWFYSGAFWQITPIPKVNTEFEGVYHVSIFSAEGCESELSNPVILSGILPRQNGDIQLIPNPTQKFVDLKANNLPVIGLVRVTIYNAMGQTIKSEKIAIENKTINHRIDLSPYGSGIYMIQIQSGSFQRMERVLKTD